MKTEKLNVIDGKLNDKNWIDLSDHRQELSIGKKVSFPINLKIRKRSNSPYFYAVWMPEEEDDYRVTNTKRRPFEVSTKTTDARQASLYAISWVKEKQRELAEKCIEISTVKTKCLEYYWDEFFTTKQASYETRKSKTKLIRDEKLKWHSPKYGIGKEDFARISADKITRNHIVKYFASLSNGMKAQQKTVLKALFQIAENDFVGHTFPSFPPITKPQEKQVTHFEKDEWQLVMETINELSFGADEITVMRRDNFEQIKLSKLLFAEKSKLLQDGMIITLELIDEQVTGIRLPKSIEVEIDSADAVVKGQTASSSYKPATTVSGIKILVPPHIKQGDKIIINSENLEYIEKSKN